MKKILVIGDSCIDTFRYGKVTRIAPEAPIPIIVPERETSNPGMAGNVVQNLKVLGHDVDFITNEDKIQKIRYVCSKYNHLLLRVDENDKCQRINPDILVNTNFKSYDAIVISDYCKGFLTEGDIEFISTSVSNFSPPIFLDTKKRLGKWAHNVAYIKINHQEYENNKEILDKDKILKLKTITTRGKYGCDFQDKNYPTQEVPVKDVSGAGDTFLAGLVADFVKYKNIFSAIDFAQKCTTIVVQKSGVSTV